MTVGNTSSRRLHSICGSLLIALSLADDEQLSTLLNCSAHLSKIASLSVRSVLPSALSSGVTQEYLGHKLFSVHHGTSSYHSGLPKTEFLLLSCSVRSLACPGAYFGLSYKYCCRQPSLIQSWYHLDVPCARSDFFSSPEPKARKVSL